LLPVPGRWTRRRCASPSSPPFSCFGLTFCCGCSWDFNVFSSSRRRLSVSFSLSCPFPKICSPRGLRCRALTKKRVTPPQDTKLPIPPTPSSFRAPAFYPRGRWPKFLISDVILLEPYESHLPPQRGPLRVFLAPPTSTPRLTDPPARPLVPPLLPSFYFPQLWIGLPLFKPEGVRIAKCIHVSIRFLPLTAAVWSLPLG